MNGSRTPISVGDFKASKAFYVPLMTFLGFELEAEYEGMMGWHNDKTLFWIAAADRIAMVVVVLTESGREVPMNAYTTIGTSAV